MTDAVRASRFKLIRLVAAARGWWRRNLAETIDQGEIDDRLIEESRLTGRFLYLTILASGIAVLGLMQSSPAVVIGAMLLSPLMGPIVGSGFALATGDSQWLRECFRTLAWGTLAAIAVSALIVVFSPLQTVTPEIASRTRPNLFDLGVALLSAMGGAYAVVRHQGGVIVGVAIATALVPPLATIGFGVATLNWRVGSGAAMLFFTNLLAISLTSALMARFWGFDTTLTPKQTRFQALGIAGAFLVLTVPLALSLNQIAWESQSTRLARSALKEMFGIHSRITQLDIDYDAKPVTMTATVLTPDFLPDAEGSGGRILTQLLGKPVKLSVDQFKVGTDPEDLETAELAAANEKSRVEEEARFTAQLVDRAALAAGRDADEVIVDRQAHRLRVTARPIEGATLAAYRQLETRIGGNQRGWRIELVPPLAKLPDIAVADDKPDAAALALAAWAGQRTGVPIVVSGANADLVANALTDAGAAATANGGSVSPTTLDWAVDR